MRRFLKYGLATALMLLLALAPDAQAQRKKRGGKRGGRGGNAGARNATAGLKKASTWDLSRGGASAPAPRPATRKPSGLSGKVDPKFEALIRRLDDRIREADALLEEAAAQGSQGESVPVLNRKEWLELEEPFFAVCDHDGNGWISFREASASLQVERAEYGLYDSDGDGRVDRPEFGRRYVEVLDRASAFRPPIAASDLPSSYPRSADQLRSAYDQDLDAGLSLEELRALLADYRREELAVEVVLEKLDWDRSSRVDGDELVQLSRLISATSLMGRMETTEEIQAASIRELFGQHTPRSVDVDATAQPPRIAGPVGHFQRLDLDGDGLLELDDLRALQAPLQLKARAGAVLAALDVDEDGVLSEAEFLGAMGRPPARTLPPLETGKPAKPAPVAPAKGSSEPQSP